MPSLLTRAQVPPLLGLLHKAKSIGIDPTQYSAQPVKEVCERVPDHGTVDCITHYTSRSSQAQRTRTAKAQLPQKGVPSVRMGVPSGFGTCLGTNEQKSKWPYLPSLLKIHGRTLCFPSWQFWALRHGRSLSQRGQFLPGDTARSH